MDKSLTVRMHDLTECMNDIHFYASSAEDDLKELQELKDTDEFIAEADRYIVDIGSQLEDAIFILSEIRNLSERTDDDRQTV